MPEAVFGKLDSPHLNVSFTTTNQFALFDPVHASCLSLRCCVFLGTANLVYCGCRGQRVAKLEY